MEFAIQYLRESQRYIRRLGRDLGAWISWQVIQAAARQQLVSVLAWSTQVVLEQERVVLSRRGFEYFGKAHLFPRIATSIM